MQYSTNLITSLIAFINEDDTLSKLGKAIRAYDTEGLPVPIRETYFSFSCKENSVTFTQQEDGSDCSVSEVVIRLNCFSPLGKSAYSAHSLTEKVTAGLCKKFRSDIKGFTIGDTQYDDDVKSYKITSLITFSFSG